MCRFEKRIPLRFGDHAEGVGFLGLHEVREGQKKGNQPKLHVHE